MPALQPHPRQHTHVHHARQSQLRVQLLGGFRVLVNDTPAPADAWRQTRAAAIVKLLALAPRHQLHREHVMETLWPDLDHAAQANTLRQMLFRARRALAVEGNQPQLLRRDGDLLVLAPAGQAVVDVDDFEQTLAAAWRADTPAAFQTALDGYAGDLLPDDRYAEWAAERRAALRASYVTAIGRLARLHEGNAEPLVALPLLQRLALLEPAEETVHLALMRLYIRAGQRQQALRQYELLCDTLRRELDAEPDPEARALAQALRSGQLTAVADVAESVPTGAASVRRSVPTPVSALIGRERELAELLRLLAERRLLTLSGPGGIGKTRLALALAQAVERHAPHTVFVVDITPIRDPEQVLAAIAQGLGIPDDEAGPPLERVLAWLRPRKALLLLDNFEQVVAAAPHVVTLLEQAPRLTVLVTSRVRLKLRGEQEYPVGPLALPPVDADGSERAALADTRAYPALALFRIRAREANPAYAITDASAPIVAEICRRLDGLPLAIELAAARSKLLPPRQLLALLERPLELLTDGPRDLPARQQTLRATLQWSYDLLAPAEQALLRGLSVFVGGWTLAAAQAVLATDPGGVDGVRDGLAALVDHSLVQLRALPDGSGRFSMLETIREFAGEQLAHASEAAELRRRHATHFRDWMVELHRQMRANQFDERSGLPPIEREHDNFRAALRWALEHDPDETGLPLIAAITSPWYYLCHFTEFDWFANAMLERAAPTAAIARIDALKCAGVVGWELRQDARSLAQLDEALRLAREIDEDWLIGNILLHASDVRIWDGLEVERVQAMLEESLERARRSGRVWTIAMTTAHLGSVARLRGDRTEAARQYHAAYRLTADGEHWMRQNVTNYWGWLALEQGQPAQAGALALETIAVARELEFTKGIVAGARLLGCLRLAEREQLRAARLFVAAEHASSESRMSRPDTLPADRARVAEATRCCRAALGEAAYTQLVAELAALAPESALRQALDGVAPGPH